MELSLLKSKEHLDEKANIINLLRKASSMFHFFQKTLIGENILNFA